MEEIDQPVNFDYCRYDPAFADIVGKAKGNREIFLTDPSFGRVPIGCYPLTSADTAMKALEVDPEITLNDILSSPEATEGLKSAFAVFSAYLSPYNEVAGEQMKILKNGFELNLELNENPNVQVLFRPVDPTGENDAKKEVKVLATEFLGYSGQKVSVRLSIKDLAEYIGKIEKLIQKHNASGTSLKQ